MRLNKIIFFILCAPVLVFALDYSSLLPKLMDATVSIKTVHYQSANEKHGARKKHGIGSGVIIDAKKGYLLTNAHVVGDSKTVSVELNNRHYLLGKVIGKARRVDLAVVQIPAKNLSAMAIGQSSTLKVGQPVFAIGSPYGFKASVASGIISALKRNGVQSGEVENYIQTDVAINPGNSGGPLTDDNGKLIGINVSIYSPDKGSSGISLAIPIDTAMYAAKHIIANGKVRYGTIGAELSGINSEMAEVLNFTNHSGALVYGITQGSPAEKAGLRVGDVIKQLNGRTISGAGELRSAIGLIEPGQRIRLGVMRGEHVREFLLMVADLDKLVKQQESHNRFFHGVLLASQWMRDSKGHAQVGLTVLSVAPNSVADYDGLKIGDRILAVNLKPVTGMRDFQGQIRRLNHKNSILLTLLRGDEKRLLVLHA